MDAKNILNLFRMLEHINVNLNSSERLEKGIKRPVKRSPKRKQVNNAPLEPRRWLRR
jgi:hypothetical protein